MNEILNLAWALLTGVLLGLFFFGGLWWTVKKGVLSPHPALFFLSSLILRTGVVLIGLYFIGHRRWERVIAFFLGFIIARIIVNLITLSKSKSKVIYPAEESIHEPQS